MTWDWSLVVVICEVAIGLGMVIFVHELGHFLVAKLCGVKCEKFYLGFDIGGWRLCRFRWGETEYGIGVLPLGGYVKMLGQEDNPARLRQEIERAKLKAEGGGPKGEGGESIDLAAAERALFDPRSYLAKSVPRRMAIISAGVVMNVIFAFLMASGAYWLGVRQINCGVGLVLSGEGGWKAGLRVGDEFEEIAGRKVARFDDLRNSIMVGDIAQGVPMVIHRPGVDEPLRIRVSPERGGMVPRIGVGPPSTTTLSLDRPPVFPGTPAAAAKPKFESGDKIVAIDGRPVQSYAEIQAYFVRDPDRPLRVTVKRPQQAGTAGRAAEQRGAERGQTAPEVSVPASRLTIEVAPRPMRWLGVTMEMGEISAIQDDSPAAKAGLREGDRIVAIDGHGVGDPLVLPDWLRTHAGQTITLKIDRPGNEQPIEIRVTLRAADWLELPDYEKNDRPISSPNLGIAYHVLNRVVSVAAGSAAAQTGIRPGDVITAATILPPEEPATEGEKVEQREAKLELSEDKRNWPALMYLLQATLPGTRVELTLEGDRKVTLQFEDAPDWFNPDRGFDFEWASFVQQARSIGEAFRMGAQETHDSLMLVARFLQKLGTQISPRALGGPITIVRAAAHFASKGVPDFLIFLAMLSANLAVLNFLPIPLLDGGHMVFLAWEGVRRKPPNERVQTALTVLGLAFIVGVMLWAIGLDFVRLFQWLFGG
jgi:regulator of sigma E protease